MAGVVGGIRKDRHGVGSNENMERKGTNNIMITIIAVISIAPYFTHKGEHTRSTIMYTCIA